MKESEARYLHQQVNAEYKGHMTAQLDTREVREDGNGWRVAVECKLAQRHELVNTWEQWEGIRDAWSLWLERQSEAQRYDRIARARVLVTQLAQWKAVVSSPHSCGCRIFIPVKGGVRCMRCWPPDDLPAELRQRINQVSK